MGLTDARRPDYQVAPNINITEMFREYAMIIPLDRRMNHLDCNKQRQFSICYFHRRVN